jgi:hypothetical protein
MAIAVDVANCGTNGNDSVTTSLTVTTTSAVASGGFIVMAFSWFDPGAHNPTISFSGGGLSWTVDKQGHLVGGFEDGVAIGSAQAPAGLASSTVLTVTLSASIASQSAIVGVSSFTGVKTTSPVDGTPLGLTSAATAAWSTGNYAITAGSLIFAMCAAEDVFTNTMSAGTEAWEGTSSFVHSAGGYRIEPSAGSYPVSGTWSSAGTNVNSAVAYLAQPSAAPASAGWVTTL